MCVISVQQQQKVEGTEIRFTKAMVATGASAAVPPIPGLRAVPHLTNNDFFNLEELPPRMVLVGAGPIGIELAQTMARFGSRVTVLEIGPHLLGREDKDAAEVLSEVRPTPHRNPDSCVSTLRGACPPPRRATAVLTLTRGTRCPAPRRSKGPGRGAGDPHLGGHPQH